MSKVLIAFIAVFHLEFKRGMAPPIIRAPYHARRAPS